jgi:hypothetical protein
VQKLACALRSSVPALAVPGDDARCAVVRLPSCGPLTTAIVEP